MPGVTHLDRYSTVLYIECINCASAQRLEKQKQRKNLRCAHDGPPLLFSIKCTVYCKPDPPLP